MSTSETGQGSAGNVIAAIASFFVPGLGQLFQGRLLAAIIHFLLCGVLAFGLLAWLLLPHSNLWMASALWRVMLACFCLIPFASAVDAARWKARSS